MSIKLTSEAERWAIISTVERGLAANLAGWRAGKIYEVRVRYKGILVNVIRILNQLET